MRTLGNIIWHFPYFGFVRSLIYAIGGAFWCITIIGIPLGLGLFQLSLFMLAPFSKGLVSCKDLELLTGEKQNDFVKTWATIIRILYFPFGLCAALMTVFTIAAEFVTLIGIPCGLAEAKAFSTIFNPINKRCVPRVIAEEVERRKASNTLNKYMKVTDNPVGTSMDTRGTENIHSNSGSTISDDGEYMRKAEAKTDEQLKFILQHKEDYHPQLIKAAEKVLLDKQTKIWCPQCHKEVAADWTVCPYCGYNIQKAREEEEARIQRAREEEKRRMEEKARAEAELKYAPGNTSQPTEEATPVTAPTTSTAPEAPSIQKTETPAPANPPVSATVVPPAPRKSSAGLIAGIIIAVLLVGGICSYIFWYRPYAKDRDALRTYVHATNLFLRSSKLAGVEYNIITKIPYGSELITYQKDSEWADIKFNGMKGYVASPFVLEKSDFDLLNNVWGNTDARDCVISTKCRNAILDFLKRSQLQSGSRGWQIFTKGKDEKPNSVYYPRLYNKNSKYTDFAFLIRDNISGGRRLVIYSFGDESELPIFRASITGIPADGYIEYMGTNRYGKIIVNFSGGENYAFNK